VLCHVETVKGTPVDLRPALSTMTARPAPQLPNEQHGSRYAFEPAAATDPAHLTADTTSSVPEPIFGHSLCVARPHSTAERGSADFEPFPNDVSAGEAALVELLVEGAHHLQRATHVNPHVLVWCGDGGRDLFGRQAAPALGGNQVQVQGGITQRGVGDVVGEHGLSGVGGGVEELDLAVERRVQGLDPTVEGG
jgi:hypothetical protein